MMEFEKNTKESFSVIGKEGSTEDGDGFIKLLWEKANTNFAEISSMAKKDGEGNLIGIWGLMSDFLRSFNPWEDNFSKGLYLAGVEVLDNAIPPAGWVKWTVPSYEFISVKAENKNTFSEVIDFLKKNNFKLAGAVHDYNCPKSGQGYLYFPIRKL